MYHFDKTRWKSNKKIGNNRERRKRVSDFRWMSFNCRECLFQCNKKEHEIRFREWTDTSRPSTKTDKLARVSVRRSHRGSIALLQLKKEKIGVSLYSRVFHLETSSVKLWPLKFCLRIKQRNVLWSKCRDSGRQNNSQCAFNIIILIITDLFEKHMNLKIPVLYSGDAMYRFVKVFLYICCCIYIGIFLYFTSQTRYFNWWIFIFFLLFSFSFCLLRECSKMFWCKIQEIISHP